MAYAMRSIHARCSSIPSGLEVSRSRLRISLCWLGYHLTNRWDTSMLLDNNGMVRVWWQIISPRRPWWGYLISLLHKGFRA